MSSSILQKGLLIVLVPFAANLVWIGLFGYSLQRSSLLIDTIRKDGEVILFISEGMGLLTKLIINVNDYVKAAGDAGIKNQVESNGFTLLASLKKLTDATAGDADTGALAERLSRSVASFEGEIRALGAAPNPLELDYHKLLPTARFVNVQRDATHLLAIMKVRNESLNNTLEMEEAQQRRTKLITLVGFLLNLLMAVVFVVFLQRNIAGRISELARRAHLLTSAKYDEEEISGNDELNQLDRELLLVSRQLQSAYHFRQTFMSIMAKRLQGPLKECIRASELLSEESALRTETGEKQLQRLHSSTSTCSNLIDDMLLLESLEGGCLRVDVQESDIKPVVETAIALVFNLTLRKNISIEQQVESAIIPVDPARIKQVLVNFLANAIKFSPVDAVITIKSERAADHLRISVIDNGPGMDEQTRSRLFQKFFQSKDGKRAGGTGLGLAIAKLIVDAHQGRIGVDSIRGHGSTFWFELPLCH